MMPLSGLTVQAKAAPKLNKTTVNMSMAETVNLKVQNTSKKVVWSSSNKIVATIDSKGVVTPMWFGKAIIAAKVDGKSLKCTVNVWNEDVWCAEYDESKSDIFNNYSVSIMSLSKTKVRVILRTSSAGKEYTSGIMYRKKLDNIITLKNCGKYNISGTIKIVYESRQKTVINIVHIDIEYHGA